MRIRAMQSTPKHAGTEGLSARPTTCRSGIGFRHPGRAPWAATALAIAVLLPGCGDSKEGVARLSPRGVPFLDGVAVPAGFKLVDKMTQDYESGGQRMARHEYRGHADPHAIRNFYREQMPLLGWNRVSDQNVKGTITIRFEKQDESCTVQIQSTGAFNRSSIQVIVMPFKRTPMEPPKRPLP